MLPGVIIHRRGAEDAEVTLKRPPITSELLFIPLSGTEGIKIGVVAGMLCP